MRRTHSHTSVKGEKAVPQYSFQCGGYLDSYRKKCSPHHITESVVRITILEQIKIQIKVMADMEKLAASIQKSEQYQSVMDALGRELTTLGRKKTRIVKLRESLYISYQEQLIDEKEYLEMKQDYLEEEKSLEAEYQKAMKRKKALDDCFVKTGEAAKQFRYFSRKKQLDREMLEALVQEVRISKENGMEIVFKFADTFQVLSEIEKRVNEYGR